MNPNLSDELPRPRPSRTVPNPFYSALKVLASLRLTVALFAISVVLVFFGTLAQKNTGIWTVVDNYFYSWVVKIDLNLPVQLGQVFLNFPTHWKLDGWFPFPAGKLIGWSMFFNLLAAHAIRFKLTWKRSGIFILHAGVITLLLGEYVTREYQVEQRMVIEENGSSNYAFDTKSSELAFISNGEGNSQTVTVIPGSQLLAAAKAKSRIMHPDVPVDVEVVESMPNSKTTKAPYSTDPTAIRDQKIQSYALQGSVESVPEVSGTDPNQVVDVPAAIVRFYKKGTDELAATFVLAAQIIKLQPFEVDGKKFDVELRWTRHYKPFRLRLEKFTHEKYPGTDIPKAYISRVRILDPERGVDREVDISMNEPLRYRGEAYFQAGFDEQSVKTTILQVVLNPGWTMPYIACILVTLGMLVHFNIFLVQYLRRLKPTGDVRTLESIAGNAARPHWAIRFAPLFAALAVALYIGSNLFHRTTDGNLDLTGVGTIPVQEGGRYKPLDTVARTSMRQVSKREDYVNVNGKDRPAIKWYLEASTGTENAPGPSILQKVFRIENLELLALLGLERRKGLRYSIEEFAKKAPQLREASAQAKAVPEKDQTPFQAKVLELDRNVKLFLGIMAGGYPNLLPPDGEGDWRSYGEGRQRLLEASENSMAELIRKVPELVDARSPEELERLIAALPQDLRVELYQKRDEALDADLAAARWRDVLSAYKSGEQDKLDKSIAEFKAVTEEKLTPGQRFRVKFEAFLNGFAPFYHNTIVYGFALALCLIGWGISIGNPNAANTIRKAVFWMLVVNFLVHAFSLISRMYLMDRPLVFVTNLYSSAVFIGCAAVGVCLFLERIYPISLGNLVASTLGLATSIIAHQIAESGDTLEMMRAVLDTNFWLATHVTTVTFGYSATYIAGVIGLVYLVLALFTRKLQESVIVGADQKPQLIGKLIGQALYGIICTAMLFSFVGTVLGGIWADQSWGRFWGWDPKENGAVLIVLWNALILHARWAGLVKTRGVAILTLVGNMVTTWSWFGTNQLGVGLHAYGFSKALALSCVLLWGSHLLAIGAALCVPSAWWKTENKSA